MAAPGAASVPAPFVRTLPVRFADVVTLQRPTEASAFAVQAALRRRHEGRVHPHGFVLPGSVAVTACGAAECTGGGSLTLRAWVAATVAAPAVGDVLAAGAARVLCAGPLGALYAALAEGDRETSVWLWLPAAEQQAQEPPRGAPLPCTVEVTRVVQRVGADMVVCHVRRRARTL